MERWMPKGHINMWPGRCNSLRPYSEDASTTQRSLYRRTHQSALGLYDLSEAKTNAELALGARLRGTQSASRRRTVKWGKTYCDSASGAEVPWTVLIHEDDIFDADRGGAVPHDGDSWRDEFVE